MSDWVEKQASSDSTSLEIKERNGTTSRLQTIVVTRYEQNKDTGEVRPPSNSNTSTLLVYTKVPRNADGDRIFNEAQSLGSTYIINNGGDERYVLQAKKQGDSFSVSTWTGSGIKNNLADWLNGKQSSYFNNVTAIGNQTALKEATSGANLSASQWTSVPGNLGIARSSNPARPDPAQPGTAPGSQQQDNSPTLNFDNASLTDIGTPNSASYFPSEVQNNTLRYPYDIIKGSTDYLQISIAKYDRGTQLIRATNDAKFKSKEGSKGNIGTIILPIPSNIQDGNSVRYSDGTLDSLTGAVVGGVLETIQTDFSGKTIQKGLEEAGRKIGNTFNAAVDAGVKGQVLRSLAVQAASIIPGAGNVTPEELLARQTGGILNPNMELLFNGVTLRSFKFSFKMTPRSKTEADEIKKIIRTLKINMAPQTLTNDNFLRTPNVFELQYMTGPQPHAFLHRFKTCALTDMSVNYTGEGIYATYSDATPNSMIMDLTFKELEPIYNTDYEGMEGVTGVGGVGY